MTALDLLPSEIILEILQHLIVYDLISVSQTCTELRALIRERRSILAGAPDSHIISLPFGSSLTNIDSNSLHFCAAQTISLLRRLRDSTVPCKKHLKLKLFHEFPVAYLHPIFLFDNILVIVHVGGEISLFDLRTKQGLFNYTLPDEDIRLVDCQQSPDRSQVILAIMPSAVVSHYEDRRVDVYRFSFRLSESDEPLALTTHELFTIGLPHEASYERLFLHGPLIVIEGSERFLICNWEENTGTSVPFPENLAEHGCIAKKTS
ncbi:hypothetical protein SISNIDRAFT_109796 [Sistotremastrum niveocremeum HHB9708]|uniref:F-box domain-containing protein n=1 Tax=Sistotremastrum niveocremeum HHB9708 TaxID=1314777 RepID=A0A164U1T4_9AGAM|nr:hypothetical protein SISNIDRAFT_109796 [Sistotremastrum niveocremeum HHB9708]